MPSAPLPSDKATPERGEDKAESGHLFRLHNGPCYHAIVVHKLAVLDKTQTIRIGKEPVVLVPLRLWHQVEDLLEDQEALSSKRFRRRIAKSRKDAATGKLLYPFR